MSRGWKASLRVAARRKRHDSARVLDFVRKARGGMTKPRRIRVGIGGWSFAPWRGDFYPKGLPHSQELAHASTHLTSIEINSTFYRAQTPTTFRKWAAATPAGFIFAVKGSRFVTNRRVLAEAGESLQRFFASGVLELGDRLGPFLW